MAGAAKRSSSSISAEAPPIIGMSTAAAADAEAESATTRGYARVLRELAAAAAAAPPRATISVRQSKNASVDASCGAATGGAIDTEESATER